MMEVNSMFNGFQDPRDTHDNHLCCQLSLSDQQGRAPLLIDELIILFPATLKPLADIWILKGVWNSVTLC
jgi:hypothetical protein